jgi:hypothetical protein
MSTFHRPPHILFLGDQSPRFALSLSVQRCRWPITLYRHFEAEEAATIVQLFLRPDQYAIAVVCLPSSTDAELESLNDTVISLLAAKGDADHLLILLVDVDPEQRWKLTLPQDVMFFDSICNQPGSLAHFVDQQLDARPLL